MFHVEQSGEGGAPGHVRVPRGTVLSLNPFPRPIRPGMMFHVEHAPPVLPSREDLVALAGRLGLRLTPHQADLSLAFLAELARWNATTSLIQASGWQELVTRHLAEGWLASQLVPEARGSGQPPVSLLDIGSGGGIPALPLHVLRPDVQVTLVEPRGRKAAFLRAVARLHDAPQPRVEACRLEELGPGGAHDVVSFRGIKLNPELVARHLAPHGRVLRFPGHPDEVREAWISSGFHVVAARPLPTTPLVVEAWELA